MSAALENGIAVRYVVNNIIPKYHYQTHYCITRWEKKMYNCNGPLRRYDGLGMRCPNAGAYCESPRVHLEAAVRPYYAHTPPLACPRGGYPGDSTNVRLSRLDVIGVALLQFAYTIICIYITPSMKT